MKRLLLAAVVAGSFAAGTASAHQCVVSDVVAEGRATTRTEGLRFVIAQVQTVEVCNEGEPRVLEESGFLRVIENGVEVCTRTDVNVSIDPFGFGAGLDMDPADTGDCAIGVSMSSLDQPTLPFAEESGPRHGGVAVSTTKQVLAEHRPQEGSIHGLRWDDELHEIGDPNAAFVRTAFTRVIAD